MAVNPTAPAVEISSRAEARHLGELGFLHWVMTFEVDLAKGGRTDYVSRTMSDWPDLGWLETLETLPLYTFHVANKKSSKTPVPKTSQKC
jgi:hypothetical protein